MSTRRAGVYTVFVTTARQDMLHSVSAQPRRSTECPAGAVGFSDARPARAVTRLWSARLLRSFFQMSIQPPEHRVIPQHAVRRLEHPVILIRKYQQLTLDPLALQCREGAQSLRVGDTEILLAVDHEHRRVPF